MAKEARYDPTLLFRFAIREHDWVLADLLARALSSDRRATCRLARELELPGAERSAPKSFAALRGLARLTRELGVDNGTAG